MRASEFITEKWSQKYKSSINCSNPKGFSQKAHCAGRAKEEDYDPNGPPPGPETKPTMPAGTVRVDVSDVYDWYKLGKHIANLKNADKKEFGKGPPSTIVSFGSEDEEHQYIKDLEKLGLTTTDIDPIDPNQPKGMPRQKVDPTYNVGNEGIGDFAPYDLNKPEYQKLRSEWEAKKKQQQTTPPNQNLKNNQPTNPLKPIPNKKTVAENFADGKKPGRKGLAKRSGVNCKASVSTLRNVAKNSSGEKARMAHWCANMKSGRKK